MPHVQWQANSGVGDVACALSPGSDGKLCSSDQDGVADVNSGEWIWHAQKQHRVRDLALDARNGLYSYEHADLCIPAKALVGVHKSGLVLRFVGYEARAPGSWLTTLRKKGRNQLGSGNVAKNRKLRRKEVKLEAENEALASEWHAAAMRLLGRTDPRDDLPLLVLINPHSGPGLAKSIWRKHGMTIICKDAGHKVDVVVTERANHAFELTRDHQDLCAAYKGIVAVSGDGLVYEVLQGLMQRSDWARCMQTLTIGILPGGSGNGLAKSLNDEAKLAHNAESSAFLIAQGNTESLDVAAVDIYNTDADTALEGDVQNVSVRRVYSFLSLEWAMIADIDIDSEYMRFLGDFRFQLEGLKRVIFTRKYKGRLSYLPCTTAHPIPRSPQDLDADSRTAGEPYWDEHAELIANAAAETPHLSLVPPPGSPLPAHWETCEGNFWSMWNCNVPWMSGDQLVARDSRVSDGLIQLNYIRDEGPQGKMSRFKFVRFLLGLDSGRHPAYCEMTPTQAYRLEPMLDRRSARQKGIIAIDGERIEYSALQMQNMRAFMRVYSAGDST